jgi:hypothetical protein
MNLPLIDLASGTPMQHAAAIGLVEMYRRTTVGRAA